MGLSQVKQGEGCSGQGHGMGKAWIRTQKGLSIFCRGWVQRAVILPAAAVPGPATRTHGRCYLGPQAWVVRTAHSPSSPIPRKLELSSCRRESLAKDKALGRTMLVSGWPFLLTVECKAEARVSDVLQVTCSYSLR